MNNQQQKEREIQLKDAQLQQKDEAVRMKDAELQWTLRTLELRDSELQRAQEQIHHLQVINALIVITWLKE